MIVIMWVILWKFVLKVVEVCVLLDFVYGVFIYIGVFVLIGIEEFYNFFIGNKLVYDEDDVFVFWGCGIFGSEVMVLVSECLEFMLMLFLWSKENMKIL